MTRGLGPFGGGTAQESALAMCLGCCKERTLNRLAVSRIINMSSCGRLEESASCITGGTLISLGFFGADATKIEASKQGRVARGLHHVDARRGWLLAGCSGREGGLHAGLQGAPPCELEAMSKSNSTSCELEAMSKSNSTSYELEAMSKSNSTSYELEAMLNWNSKFSVSARSLCCPLLSVLRSDSCCPGHVLAFVPQPGFCM